MSDLTFIEKNKLEKLFGMTSGYVMGFSDRTFGEFVVDSVGRNIFEERYRYASGSKANRLRAFWTKEPNYLTAKLLADLIAFRTEGGISTEEEVLVDQCRRIVAKLRLSAPVPDVDALSPNASGPEFEILARSVRDAIETGQPESALDRLHTFVTKYIRELCSRVGITVERNKPLQSLLGEYIKQLRELGLVKSVMAERILKSSIATFEAFDKVRNEQSLAHDNTIVGYDESILILSNVAATIKFVESIEAKRNAQSDSNSDPNATTDDLPY